MAVRSTKERTYYKYVNGESIKYTVTPTLGGHQKNNPKIVYSLDFEVTPHQLGDTYILIFFMQGLILKQFNIWLDMRTAKRRWTFMRK